MKNLVFLLAVRTFLYILMIAGVAYLVSFEGYRDLSASDYGEQSLTEHLHALLSLLTAICFSIVAWKTMTSVLLR